MSVRSTSERGQTGNRVSAWLAPLPLSESRPLDRFRQVRATTASYRDQHEEQGAEVLTETAEWTTAQPLRLAIRWISQARAYNLIVTNIPGPQVPLFLLDANVLINLD